MTTHIDTKLDNSNAFAIIDQIKELALSGAEVVINGFDFAPSGYMTDLAYYSTGTFSFRVKNRTKSGTRHEYIKEGRGIIVVTR